MMDQMDEARERVKQAGYADTELEPYITYIKWFYKTAGVERFNPYMTVDGRVKEAVRNTDGKFSVRTYLNTSDVGIRVSMGASGEIIVPPRCCVAIFYDQNERVHMGTASIGSEGMVDRTNPLENAETSAVGRALGLAGYGLIPGAGIASAEEMGVAALGQSSNDVTAGPEELGAIKVTYGWGKDKKFQGMSLEEVYEDPDGYGAMSWCAADESRQGTFLNKKMAQYFNLREAQKDEGEVPDGMSLEEYDQAVTVSDLISYAEAKSINELVQANLGEGKLFGHANHVRNHLKSHFNMAKVVDLTSEKAPAFVRYIKSGGKDKDPRWYKDDKEELFGAESIEDLLKKAAPHLPEPWQDKPEKWWASLCQQYSIGILNAKQLGGARVLLQAVASGGMDMGDPDSATYQMFLAQMQGIANDG